MLTFEKDGSSYMLRAMDADLGVEKPRICLPGEDKVMASNSKIGGTQMGSGTSECIVLPEEG